MSSLSDRGKQSVISLCEYPLLTIEVRHIVCPKSIEVLVVPADGSPLKFETLHTVETDIPLLVEPPLSPTDLHAKKAIDDAEHAHMIYIREENACQPNISRLPDTKHHKYWNEEAWNHRCVTSIAKFHLFLTRSKSGLTANPHVMNRAFGDMFILKVSNTKDLHGRNFYVDMKSDDLGPGWEMVDLLRELPVPTQ